MAGRIIAMVLGGTTIAITGGDLLVGRVATDEATAP